MKQVIKRILLRKVKGIYLDKKSRINYGVIVNSNSFPTRVVNSIIHIDEIGEGCFFENITCYGNISIGNYVSISGPGTILHSEVNKIKIGNFVSIAANVSIQEFNHVYNKLTTFSTFHNIFKGDEKFDFCSKGSILIEDDVWIGSNSVVLSGVKIGRGAIVGAGSVVTKDIPKFAIVAGNPAKIIKYRFNTEIIDLIENTHWWEMGYKELIMNEKLFLYDVESKEFNKYIYNNFVGKKYEQ